MTEQPTKWLRFFSGAALNQYRRGPLVLYDGNAKEFPVAEADDLLKRFPKNFADCTEELSKSMVPGENKMLGPGENKMLAPGENKIAAPEPLPITLLAEFKAEVIDSLNENGYDTIEKILAVTPEDLQKVKFVGAATAVKLIEACKALKEEQGA